jgi:hypothetical protein
MAESMDQTQADANMINLTIKTPKEKESVTISGEANIKDVSLNS